MQAWFKLSSNIVDREDLSIYEKMCCVVLARYSEDENINGDISIEQLAVKMGVEDIIAKGAFYSLMSKGMLELADQTQIIKPGTIIKADKQAEIKSEEEEAVEEALKEELNEELKEETVSVDSGFEISDLVLSASDKIKRVCEIVDEKISDREARIILSFADNDLKKVIDKYKVAKASQYQDKIEVLMHELQKKEKVKSNIIKKSDFKEKDVENKEPNKESKKELNKESTEEISQDMHLRKTQVNTYKINLMKKYNKK